LVDYSRTKPVREKGNITTERASKEARVLENSSIFQRFPEENKHFRHPAKKLPSAWRKHF
jgi:hypothetical protein